MTDPDWAADPSVHVVLPNVHNEMSGVAAEREWIKRHYPNHGRIQQRCRRNEVGRQIDEIILAASDGTRTSVFFNVTDWYGKS